MVDTQHYCQVHTHLHHPYPHYYRHDAGEYILNWLVARWPSGSHTLALSSRWFLPQRKTTATTKQAYLTCRITKHAKPSYTPANTYCHVWRHCHVSDIFHFHFHVSNISHFHFHVSDIFHFHVSDIFHFHFHGFRHPIFTFTVVVQGTLLSLSRSGPNFHFHFAGTQLSTETEMNLSKKGRSPNVG